MTIKQKLIVFASSMVLVAMVIATLVSNVVFNNMLTNSAVRYLETASYSAQELRVGNRCMWPFLGPTRWRECRRPWRGGILLRWKNSSGE